MKEFSQETFINEASKTLSNILDSFKGLEILDVEDLVEEEVLYRRN